VSNYPRHSKAARLSPTIGEALDALTAADEKVREALAIVKSLGKRNVSMNGLGSDAFWLCGRIATTVGYTLAILGELERRDAADRDSKRKVLGETLDGDSSGQAPHPEQQVTGPTLRQRDEGQEHQGCGELSNLREVQTHSDTEDTTGKQARGQGLAADVCFY